jgi:hypothetical protein
MRYILDISEDKMLFAEEFFKSISFVKKVRVLPANEITNSAILQSIEQYEKGKLKPTPLNLEDLKKMIYA